MAGGIDQYTKLLMHMDNSIKDELGKTITLIGNTTIKTDTYKFGSGSAYFDGNGDLIKIPCNLDFDFRNEDFTIDFWIKPDNLPSSYFNIFRKHPTSGTPYSYGFAISSTGQLCTWLSSNTTSWDIASGTVIATGIVATQWNHIAIVRTNGKVYGFINGVMGTPISTTLAFASNTTEITIGGHDTTDFYKGYIDEFRISKGIARWTNNFTPQTYAYGGNLYLIQDKNNILYTGSGGGCSANLIPVMTSNTAPSGVASASSIVSSNYDAYKAFDGTNADTNDCWMTVSGTITGWLKYDFGSGNEKIIGQYMVSARNYATTSSPKTWTFEGSNDNVSWSVLDTRAGEAVWSQSERRTYTFINNNKYRYYRINVTESYGTTYLSIANLEMFEKIMLQLNNLNTTTLSDSLFINKGITDPTVINNKQPTQRGIYGTDKGTLGTGKYFEFSLDSTFKSVNNIK